MRETINLKILFLLLPFVLFVWVGCSQMSLFDLVESEQEGEFSLGVKSVNLKVGSEFNFNSVGGYLPYTYAVSEGTDPGTIDPATGAYTAPGTVGEATVECSDGIGHRDSASVTIYDYEGIMSDPATFGIHVGDPDQEIFISGGVGVLSAAAEKGEVNPTTFSSGDTVRYSPPATTGTDEIEILDELGNSLTIKVDVLPAAGTAVLEILPTYAVVAPGGDTQSFDITNNTGNSLTIALEDSFGSIDNNVVTAGETSATVIYTAPSTEGAVYLSVTDDVTGDSVQADIYVQGEATPLEISPSTVRVTPGTTVEFTASGGFPPYVFSQLNGSGTLVQTSPTTANYTPESVISMIRVTDGVGNQAKVKIQTK